MSGLRWLDILEYRLGSSGVAAADPARHFLPEDESAAAAVLERLRKAAGKGVGAAVPPALVSQLQAAVSLEGWQPDALAESLQKPFQGMPVVPPRIKVGAASPM